MHYSTIYCTQLIEEQKTKWPKEKVKKDKQRFSKHAHKTKDRVTRHELVHGRSQELQDRIS